MLAHLAAAERAMPARLLGVALGFGGVAAMVGADLFAAPLPAVGLMLLGNLSYGLAGLWGGAPPVPSAGVALALLGVALLCSALAHWLYFALLEAAGPVNVLLVTLLIPPVAAVLGWAGRTPPAWR